MHVHAILRILNTSMYMSRNMKKSNAEARFLKEREVQTCLANESETLPPIFCDATEPGDEGHQQAVHRTDLWDLSTWPHGVLGDKTCSIFVTFVASIIGGIPIARWFTMEIPIQMDDFGLPPFQETSISSSMDASYISHLYWVYRCAQLIMLVAPMIMQNIEVADVILPRSLQRASSFRICTS